MRKCHDVNSCATNSKDDLKRKTNHGAVAMTRVQLQKSVGFRSNVQHRLINCNCESLRGNLTPGLIPFNRLFSSLVAAGWKSIRTKQSYLFKNPLSNFRPGF